MTNFTKTRLTDKGLALLAKEGVSVTITKVKTGNGEYQADENTGEMTQLKSEKQQFEVLSATKKSDTVYSIKFAMSNKELSEDYLFTEVGVYATDPDEGEILYAVCYATNENADIIRKFSGLYEFKAIIVLNISVNSGGTVKFISEGMYALAEDVQELSQKFSKHIEDKNVHVTEEEQKKWDAVEDKVDKSNIVNNLITTEEGFAADARQLNKSIEDTFAYAINRDLANIKSVLSYKQDAPACYGVKGNFTIRNDAMTACLVVAKVFSVVGGTSALWFVTFIQDYKYPEVYEIYKGKNITADFHINSATGEHYVEASSAYGGVNISITYLC